MRKTVFCALLGLSLTSIGCVSVHTSMHPAKDHAEVRSAVSGFHRALNAMFKGDAEPMKKVWSHRDDITYMGPAGGILRGWEKICASWEEQAALRLSGEISPKDMHITVGRDLAIVKNYEVGYNLGPDGKRQDVSIRTTSVFRKEDRRWKMIGHHTDLLDFLQK